MKDIYIFGAGGFGREVAWLIERINESSMKSNGNKEWNILGFIDDNKALHNTKEGNYFVVGGSDILLNSEEKIYVVCAIGSANVRKKIIDKISSNNNIEFPVLIDPSVIYSNDVVIGEGTIICAGTIITVNVNIGKHVIINLDCTLGHDDIVGDFTTVYPSVNISGQVKIGDCAELGTGMQIIQGIEICENTIIGAGAVVVKDINIVGTYIGIPVRLIKN